jgi:hypothetical protein
VATFFGSSTGGEEEEEEEAVVRRPTKKRPNRSINPADRQHKTSRFRGEFSALHVESAWLGGGELTCLDRQV